MEHVTVSYNRPNTEYWMKELRTRVEGAFVDWFWRASDKNFNVNTEMKWKFMNVRKNGQSVEWKNYGQKYSGAVLEGYGYTFYVDVINS